MTFDERKSVTVEVAKTTKPAEFKFSSDGRVEKAQKAREQRLAKEAEEAENARRAATAANPIPASVYQEGAEGVYLPPDSETRAHARAVFNAETQLRLEREEAEKAEARRKKEEEEMEQMRQEYEKVKVRANVVPEFVKQRRRSDGGVSPRG